jgi:glycerol-3-phosphate O-acyltransferase
MNHRSNADYVVVAYVLSGNVALSCAVGEWAREVATYALKVSARFLLRRALRYGRACATSAPPSTSTLGLPPARALVMLTLRRVVSADGDGFRIDRGQDGLLRYYANSIEHLLEAAASAARV